MFLGVFEFLAPSQSGATVHMVAHTTCAGALLHICLGVCTAQALQESSKNPTVLYQLHETRLLHQVLHDLVMLHTSQV